MFNLKESMKSLFYVAFIFAASFCWQLPLPAENLSLQLTSPAFKDQEVIPDRYTCKGADINPPLVIDNLPKDTKSLVLIVDNPDAPEGVWVHWVVYNIPVESKIIKEKSNPGIQGLNDFGRFKYHGPCPVDEKKHKYFFKTYALDKEIEINEGVIKSDIEDAMHKHILAQGELVGVVQRKYVKRDDE